MPDTAVIPTTESSHRLGLSLFQEGKYAQAAAVFAEALKRKESSEIWNDWATAMLMCNQTGHSEQGYRRAIELDPRSNRAAGNLGILLASRGRLPEAIPLLERGANGSTGAERQQLLQALETCRGQATSKARTCSAPETDLLTQAASVISLQSQAIADIAKRLSAVEAKVGAADIGVPLAAPSLAVVQTPPVVEARPSLPAQGQLRPLDLNYACLFSVKGGRPALALCNERIIEIPFVHRNIPYPFEGRVLDVGSRESQMAFELACLGFESWAIDIRAVIGKFPGVRQLRADIRHTPFESRSFDVVIALSTLEHIGLIAYENTQFDEEGDIHALEEIHRILKPEKKLLLTVPFGIRGKAKSYRVYDHDALVELLARCGFQIESEDYWRQAGLPWTPAHWSEAEAVDSLTRGAKAVACIVARRGRPVSAQPRGTTRPEGARDATGEAAARSPLPKAQEGISPKRDSTQAAAPHVPSRETSFTPAQAPSAAAVPRPGVFFRGYIYAGSGYAEENWMEALGLAGHQIPIQLVPVGESFDEKSLIPGPARQKLKSLQRQLVDMPKSVIYQASPAGVWDLERFGRYRVGRTMFETDRLPLGFLERCNAMDEVWLPSRFNMDTFAAAGVDEQKLRLMPPGVDASLFRPGVEPLAVPKKRDFNFLSIFDWQLRKGYDVLLKAYLQEFKPGEDVALILKVYQTNDTGSDIETQISFFIEREAGVALEKAPDVILINGFIPQEKMVNLYAAADCFVLPTRGEGYGRPYLEALACEIPVIATNWSGQTDFLSPQNSYLIETKVTPVPDNVDLELFLGHRWAEPCLGHLRQLMREVYSRREEARRKAVRGRQDILQNYDWSVVIPRWVNEFQRLLN